MSAYPIPAAALAHHVALLGKTGSGKSNAAKTIVEADLDAGERVCVLDPTGSWYGLRLTAKGKPSPYRVVIFGGAHADVQIGAAHGAAIAETIGTTSTPAVIDTRLMTVGDRTRFFTDFAETLLRKNRGPLRLVIDEAHLFAPQGRVADPQSGKMLHAANNLVSLGRSIGLRVVMLTQRPAKLHKDSLTQVETLIAMRLIAPQDRAAVDAWIGEWADAAQGREIIASLPGLPTGDAWIWSPEIGVLKREHFPLARTFDSGRAPTGGEEGPALQPLDLKEVTARLEQVAADVLANDPKALKVEIARLKAELAKKPAGASDRDVQAAREQGHTDGYARGRQDGEAFGLMVGKSAMWGAVSMAVEGLKPDEVTEVLKKGDVAPQTAIQPRSPPLAQRAVRAAPASVAPTQPAARAQIAPTSDPEAGGGVPPGCAKPLAALAAVYPSGLTEPQWATAAGYKRTGGTWGTYKSRLRGAGLIEQREGRWFATEVGAEAVGDVELPPQPGPELVRWWASRLPGTSRIADALIEAWPRELDRDELAELVGMTPSGGTYGTYLSRLSGPGIIQRNGRTVRLSEEVMLTP